jgi:hypothetical protein
MTSKEAKMSDEVAKHLIRKTLIASRALPAKVVAVRVAKEARRPYLKQGGSSTRFVQLLDEVGDELGLT